MHRDTAQTHVRPIEDALDVLEQLPHVILVAVPVGKGVAGVQEARVRTDDRMEGWVVEEDLLEGEGL